MNDLTNIITYTKQLKLLYIEDNPQARNATLAILKEFFNEISTAVDGADGLEKFKQSYDENNKPFDIIITDINMPKLNGLKMIAAIRDKDIEIPILVLSAYNESGFFMDSIKLGIEGYLLKPIDMQQFIGVLGKVIERIKLKNDAKRNLNLLYQYQEITDQSGIISKTDPNGVITYVNDAFAKISEFTKEELIGQNHNIVRHPDNSPLVYRELWTTIKHKKQMWRGIVRNISKSGKAYYARTTVKPILDNNGEIIEFIAIRDNITDIMNPREQLQDLVLSVDESVVTLIRIEEFDDIEKFYGQKLASKIEEKFATTIIETLPNNCDFSKVYILGDGDYALAKTKKDLHNDVDAIINTLREFQHTINNTTINIGEVEYDISIVISISYGENALENARYGLKELLASKQDFIVANNLAQKEQSDAEKNLQVIKMIKTALEHDRVISFFQAIVDNKTKKIDKYESLVRIIDENNKIISPFFFLDIAKKGKYYAQITMKVIQNSFYSLRYTDVDISINISVLDIEKESTRNTIYKQLEKYSNNAHRIVFELLEDEDVKDFNLVKKFISKVKGYGAKIAIDDFGAGYSNFERLLDYQPDILKIDGSLVKNIQTNKLSLSIVKTIVTFAKEQDIKTVAEFVENEEIYNILNDLGVDYSQGYYFSKPSALVEYN